MRFFRSHNNAPGLKGDVHPFMQIKRNGVGAFDPLKFGSDVLRQYSHRADRAIHMEPDIFAFAQISQCIQIIDRARVDGAGIPNHTNRTIPCFAILYNRLF